MNDKSDLIYAERLFAALESDTGRPAVVHHGRAWSRGELLERGRRLARRLQLLGVSPGDRVALLLDARMPGLIAQLGASLAGAIAVPLNPRLPPTELPFYLADSGAVAAVIDSEQAASLEEVRPPSLRHAVVGTLEEDGSAAGYRAPAFSPGDDCLMIYSSGTTGWPKGVVHGQGNLASALTSLAACWRMMSDDRVVHVLPLFHVHGLCFAAQLPLLVGATVLLEDGFDPARTLDALDRGSVFMAVPTIYYRLLDNAEFRERKSGFPSIRLFTCGSAPIRPEVLPQLEAILGGPVINRYGMSEAHVITSLPLDGPWPGGSVGLPLDGIEVEVRRDDGSRAAPGEVGGVRIRGRNLFRRYWNNPDATRAAFADGWFETGDLGARDEAGFLTLAGRKHDLIIVSGFNVYPAAVERVLNGCPGVRESAVVGVPDALKGEAVAAFVVRADDTLTESAVERFCRERLTGYQRPARVAFVNELPRNAMGKVLKRELRDRL
jgi:malonyl-CoA/methylmalonyl-CoA synthetase